MIYIIFFCLLCFFVWNLYNDNYRYRLIIVVDGDTIHLFDTFSRNILKVRLIGIDSPESNSLRFGKIEKYGVEATNFLKTYIYNSGSKAEKIYFKLQFDAKKYDKYGRELCYVYLKGVMINALMVEKGWARAVQYPPNLLYSEHFKYLEKNAKSKKRGIWR